MSIDRILNWIKTEPVRVHAYSVIVLVAGYLMAKGYVQPSDVAFVTSLAALVLGVEKVRSAVSPTAYVPKHKQ